MSNTTIGARKHTLRCPRTRPHAAHTWSRERPSAVFGKVTTTHQCPGREERIMTTDVTPSAPTPKCWCGGATTVTFNQEGLRSLCCVDSEFHDPTSDGRPEAVEVLYVSGPMSGYPECNYPAFREATKALQDAGYTVVDPSEVTTPGRHHYTDLLKEDIRNLLDCHGVALLDRWWESSGARCEVHVAGITRMPVRTVEEWVRIKHDAAVAKSVAWKPWESIMG